jgi:pimeloyl-ACP methyl ester carboxylesterase
MKWPYKTSALLFLGTFHFHSIIQAQSGDFEGISSQNRALSPPAFSRQGGGTKLPCPIVFVHGLVGSSSTWEVMGDFLAPAIEAPIELKFCLNTDGSNYTSDAAEDIESFIPIGLAPANQYLINFNCNSFGTCSTTGSLALSNQSAIFKQAEAIGIAIDRVLESTGAAEVILVGHSMGGVACREYLQNEVHWQTNTHRVAKLVTSGSPHVGFDLGSTVWKALGLFEGIYADAEAMRDLKNTHSGFLSSVPGVFFWGGTEDQEYMYDDVFYWNNVDVNCNGMTGENIQGLNQRAMYSDLEFASLHDTYDLVVSPTSANFNYTGEVTGGEDLCAVLDLGWTSSFDCESWGWDVPGGATTAYGHTALPLQTIQTLWALDEADDYDNSLRIQFNQNYAGFFTPQSTAADGYSGYSGSYSTDWDDYIINVPSPGGTLTVSAQFIDDAQGADVLIYDVSSGQYVEIIENVGGTATLSATVSGGQHIVEFNHVASENPGFSQYFFHVTLDLASKISNLANSWNCKVWPNPATNSVNFEIAGDTDDLVSIRITDLQGRTVFEDAQTARGNFSVSQIPRGTYILIAEISGVLHCQPLVLN